MKFSKDEIIKAKGNFSNTLKRVLAEISKNFGSVPVSLHDNLRNVLADYKK